MGPFTGEGTPGWRSVVDRACRLFLAAGVSILREMSAGERNRHSRGGPVQRIKAITNPRTWQAPADEPTACETLVANANERECANSVMADAGQGIASTSILIFFRWGCR